MWISRFQDPIFYEEIEVAADACWSKPKTFAENDSCRRPIFEDRARHRITGAEVIEFHNSIVS
jgi:hypothetical protein